MKQYLQKLLDEKDLSQAESQAVFDSIMSGEATPAQIAAFIIALRMKGETAEEIAGGACSMRRHAVFVDAHGLNVIDTCGTGGDSSGTFNVSTTSAFVVAGAGIPVAKHGNRAISSKCGSADLLAQLGVNIEALPEVMEECIREAGFGFLFAPKLHPAMKHAMGPRKELGVRTIFNMLGPLTNPSGAKAQIIGVFAPELTETFAKVLKLLGSRHAFIVHGKDGMDEITTTTATRVSELKDGAIKTYEFDPLPFIGEFADLEQIKGGDAAMNADITRKILAGEKSPCRDIVCLNAAAAIIAGGKAKDMAEGWKLAQQSIDAGNARTVLSRLVEISNS